MEIGDKMALSAEQPRTSLSVVSARRSLQWVNNQAFYSMLPAPYLSFYQNWVKEWLQWYDGFVPYIHGGQNGLLSTNIGTTLVNRSSDCVVGGSIMFSNARTPNVYTVDDKGKKVGKALDFISNKWDKECDFRGVIKKAIKNAYAGGFSLLKLNNGGGRLWVDTIRADRFFFERNARGQLRKVVSFISFYDNTIKKENSKRYGLIEERRFEEIGAFGQEIPVVEYKIYETNSQIQYFNATDNSIRWEDLPKDVRKAFKSEYGFRLNEPQAMNGFSDLGCYVITGSDEISNCPQFGMGESLLANILTYLYEYEFYNTAFNTDMYLARGRVMIPKPMQSPNARAGSQPSGLDDFAFTKYESLTTDSQKPEAIQFALRSAEWKEARNILLESIATGIGLSVSTLASYLNDGSNRTAREVSAEESATTLFIENARRRFEKPINDCIATVLRFYGYTDDVEVRWSRAGMSNTTVLVDTLSRAIESGLISRKKAHSLYNYDDDESQNAEDFALVEKERQGQEMQFDAKDYYGG